MSLIKATLPPKTIIWGAGTTDGKNFYVHPQNFPKFLDIVRAWGLVVTFKDVKVNSKKIQYAATNAMGERFVVMTASSPSKSSWKWQHPRKKVAIVEKVDPFGPDPVRIDHRLKSVKQIVVVWKCLYVGKTYKCQYDQYRYFAEKICYLMNCGLDLTDAQILVHKNLSGWTFI